MTDPYIPILLSFIAGISTGIGSLIAILFKKMNMKILSFSLGLSAGVMTYVSFVELLPDGVEALGTLHGTLLFFGGIFFILILDLLIPEQKNPHHITDIVQGEQNKCPEIPPPAVNKNNWDLIRHKYSQFRYRWGNRNKDQDSTLTHEQKKVKRMGIITAITIFLHNIPEGLITFMTASHDIQLGFIIAFAVAIHNIPEGISVAMPIIYATKNKKKAFMYSFLSGLAEPSAAILAAVILWPFLTEEIIGGLVVFTAGIMVYISLDEILPTAHKYCTDENDGHPGHSSGLGVIFGMLIMAFSLIILG